MALVYSTYYLWCIRRVKCWINIFYRCNLALDRLDWLVLRVSFSCTSRAFSYNTSILSKLRHTGISNVTHSPKKNFVGIKHVKWESGCCYNYCSGPLLVEGSHLSEGRSIGLEVFMERWR